MDNFEIIVRAVIEKDGKTLVCQTKGSDYFFLPGGHIEFSETIEKGLDRELKEELGVGVKSYNLIGSLENIFNNNNILHHEFNFVFKVEVNSKVEGSKEDHLEIFWFSKNEFENKKVLPYSLRSSIIKWMGDKESFFIEMEK